VPRSGPSIELAATRRGSDRVASENRFPARSARGCRAVSRSPVPG
jgi:hypothetical protein